MPELILPYGQDEYVCAAISVKMYRRYTEIMERNESDLIEDAFEANLQILSEVFEVPARKLQYAETEDVLTAVKEIHFFMQEVITAKFLELNPERPEQQEKEKSIFDEYDEENGYNDETDESNIWKTCRENIDRIVKLCIRVMKNSYQQCMESEIMSLLDYVAFEIRTIKEN
jgi:hypothetical protein